MIEATVFRRPLRIAWCNDVLVRHLARPSWKCWLKNALRAERHSFSRWLVIAIIRVYYFYCAIVALFYFIRVEVVGRDHDASVALTS